MNINEIESKIRSIATQLEKAQNERNASETIRLKKEYHKAKLEAIEAIEAEEKRNGITARQLIEMVDGMPHQPKYAIGIKPIDDALNDYDGKRYGLQGGIETGSFINLAGESGAGKTTLTIDILANVAEYSKVVFFNHEMGLRRMAGRLKRRLKTEAQLDNMIIDSSTDKLNDICIEVALHAHQGVKFFVIDSRMKIRVDGDMSDVQKNSLISSELSRLAREKDIILILINQMAESDIKEGRLALKGSGDAKYDSDIVLFYVIDRNKPNQRKLICTKNRTGSENLFSVDLTIKDGKTVGINEAVEIVYEDKKIDSGFVL